MKFTLRLVSPEGVKYEGEVDEAVLPTSEGEIGILANHEPLISLLSPGEIRLKEGSREHFLSTYGGVVRVADNVVEVLAESATFADELDQVKINEAKTRAEQQLKEAKDQTDFASASGMLEKIIASEKVLKRRKKYR